MALVLAGGDCTTDTCIVEPGGPFTLAVEIVTAPAEGYIGAQSFIAFGSDLVYNPADTQADEVSWPGCDTATIVRFKFPPETVNTGCLTGLTDAPTTLYTGPFVELSFTCSTADSSTEVQLLPAGDDFAGTSGTGFFLAGGPTPVASKVDSLTVNCGGGSTPTDIPITPGQPTSTLVPTTNTRMPPTSTPAPPISTPTATPTIGSVPIHTTTSTPSPIATRSPTPQATPTSVAGPGVPGDANCDGVTDPIDAALVLQYVAALLDSLECLEAADVNGDGSVNVLDAALILQFSAGLIGQLPLATNP